jgi:hypothetical protein
VESSCEFGIEPSGSIKCWKLSSVETTRDLSSNAQLQGVSYVWIKCLNVYRLLVGKPERRRPLGRPRRR